MWMSGYFSYVFNIIYYKTSNNIEANLAKYVMFAHLSKMISFNLKLRTVHSKINIACYLLHSPMIVCLDRILFTHLNAFGSI